MRGTVLKRLRHGIGRERGLGFREGSKVQAKGRQRRTVGEKLGGEGEAEGADQEEDEDDDEGPLCYDELR